MGGQKKKKKAQPTIMKELNPLPSVFPSSAGGFPANLQHPFFSDSEKRTNEVITLGCPVLFHLSSMNY